MLCDYANDMGHRLGEGAFRLTRSLKFILGSKLPDSLNF